MWLCVAKTRQDSLGTDSHWQDFISGLSHLELLWYLSLIPLLKAKLAEADTDTSPFCENMYINPMDNMAGSNE